MAIKRDTRKHVVFNDDDKKRYALLGIKTPLHIKVKQLFNDFCDEIELKRLERKKGL